MYSESVLKNLVQKKFFTFETMEKFYENYRSHKNPQIREQVSFVVREYFQQRQESEELIQIFSFFQDGYKGFIIDKSGKVRKEGKLLGDLL